VHDVPLDAYIKPDPDLDALLHALPFRKVIFTNAHYAYALRVTKALDISHHFETVIDIYKMAPFCKPQPQAFEIALGIIDEPGNNCILVDDSPLNLKTAESFGMAVISIGSRTYANSPHITKISDLRYLFEDIINS
jgi:putative hydrolase of the HAD superfamily